MIEFQDLRIRLSMSRGLIIIKDHELHYSYYNYWDINSSQSPWTRRTPSYYKDLKDLLNNRNAYIYLKYHDHPQRRQPFTFHWGIYDFASQKDVITKESIYLTTKAYFVNNLLEKLRLELDVDAILCVDDILE